MGKGKIIVFEGLDGSGKTTQLELAESYLSGLGVKCRAVSFPNYSSTSGKLIGEYLKGKIPCDGYNGAYAASAMYALDRYISYMTDWRGFYENGGVILSGRYTTSNAIYQLTKIPPEQHGQFLDWLMDFEYGKLGLPEPDTVIYLDMPIEMSQRLLESRYLDDGGKKDIHESNVRFLEECRKSAMYAANICGWQIIDCSNGNIPLPIEDVYEKICAMLRVLVSNG
ncbi:MAG: thymidylate kinase [Lachnospiraceae bacterium]|nr:thymidylate kinase [Ruminococcus sp.]MCM1274013.1 thymidylate kinase [Lachnospiraceae bacterium]